MRMVRQMSDDERMLLIGTFLAVLFTLLIAFYFCLE